ncbi:hypothetical protein GO755_20730 [Spirosoma sp. HMF4905]|uniref:Uncharacterized protein n=1 Tax=Spirosoma arboris TaxID=2682092 RepID=A0A7K1SF80_9BACT|nr:hypothetical protein [Spirosoma arboris]MVM32480.1 hypothetical protein [Spirosoma arboris]
MKLKAITDPIQHEIKVLQGEATKDVRYDSQHTFPSESMAIEAFERSVAKLLNVRGWSDLSSLTADFQLYDQLGSAKTGSPQVGDYIQVVLPGPTPENWVRVIHTSTEEKRVEFTVQPCPDPMGHEPDHIEHFFQPQARSTFRVERLGTTITASEIGQHEGINNEEPQAGGRSLINTVIAEAGWLFYQKMQWKLLTDYLVDL